MTFLKKHILTIIGLGVGAVGGFLYWKFIGCNSGTCAITSDPYKSSLYGLAMGGLLFSMFQKDKKKDTASKSNQ